MRYHKGELNFHYGSLHFMGLSLISIFIGIFFLFGSQVIITEEQGITKELRLLGIKLISLDVYYDEILMIQRVNKFDLRLTRVDNENLFIDGLDADQFYRLSMFLMDATGFQIEESVEQVAASDR